jgi:acyl-CoA synthetase (AMP-forming)/AMP-acid ligase II
MDGRKIAVTPSAYSYPLLIKQLLHAPLAQTAHQEIVYRDVRRLTYLELRDRIGRLASALQKIGVRPGDSAGVLDWDSNRFLEAFFAIPMMGVVLQTVNVRLSPEQIAYTIDHAGSSTLLVNDEFVDLVQSILPKLSKVKRLVVLTDRKAPVTGKLEFAGEYEELLAAASPDFDFPDFDENVQATTFYTTGTTGQPKGVYYSHRQLVLHAMAELAVFGLAAKQGSFHRDDVYMPITPMFHVHAWGFPWAATLAGVKQVYPGRYDPALLIRLIKTEGVTFTHGVPTILQMLLDAARQGRRRSRRPEDGDRGVRAAEGARQAGDGARRRCVRRLRYVRDWPTVDGCASQVERPFRRSRPGSGNTHHGRTRLPAGRFARRRRRYERSASRRRDIRRDRRAGALADQRLLQQSRSLRATMGGRLSAHQ